MKAQAIAILGTGSDVGKSVIAAGICRILSRSGIRVAPFKAQNMSNNSFVTPDGKEIARAQALQAQACGIDPHEDMNPVLLKPESDRRSQVIVQGIVWMAADAQDYFQRHQELALRVRESYGRLAERYEAMVIEGAGSACEMNLRNRDLANWFSVEMADAKVILVADIDRGGVFAQVIGTMGLLSVQERRRVAGIVINKFRGDQELFADGVSFIERHTGIPVAGVVPFLRDLTLEEEDTVRIGRRRLLTFQEDRVNVAVILLPRMSNFSDFTQLAEEEDVVLKYAERPQDVIGADVVVIPGSKNTIEDLIYLRRAGFEPVLRKLVKNERELVGICGGFQMLGRSIADPYGVESGGWHEGLALLDATTTLLINKVTRLVDAQPLNREIDSGVIVRGYRIHMGETIRGADRPAFRVLQRGCEHLDNDESVLEGAMSSDGLIWGSYIHGLFDQPGYRRQWLNSIRRRKGLSEIAPAQSEALMRRMEQELDRWANHLLRHVDLERMNAWSSLR